MKKNLICAAAALLVLCFAGCGQNTYPDTAPTNNTKTAVAQDIDGLYDYDADILTEAAYEGTNISPNTETQEMPRAGLLTAGVWSDNENWGFFSNLISSNRLTYPLFGLDPTKRILVTVKNPDGSAAPNVPVWLTDENDFIIWQGVSDHLGRVYLINQTNAAEVYASTPNVKKQRIEGYKPVTSGENTQSGSVSSAEATLTLDTAATGSKNADIMFIIDSTGSMYDEMEFLQTEFSEIVSRIGTENTRWSVNFYRDEGDEYLTKCNPFSSDAAKVQEIISREEAAGGQGQIAAVAQALNETMTASDWSEDSVKLAFLIFDAPPYKEAADSLAASVETAAARGIRLIPVVGSGSDSDVEQFGRAIAIETGGTYVFLTDDSGIGESHEEPIIGEHEVKPLIDIITDIINEYRGQ